jgi:DNA-binding Lrp family transcriptional regulator
VSSVVVAYVAIKASTSEADRLLETVSQVDGVVDAHIVAGDVDLIAKLNVDSPAAVKQVAAENLGGIDGVESTTTYVAME